MENSLRTLRTFVPSVAVCLSQLLYVLVGSQTWQRLVTQGLVELVQDAELL